jgi:hypothetical protein
VSFLQAIPVWGYFIVLGLAFILGHLLAFRPDPTMRRGRRLAGRWGSSLLLLLGLLLVSNRAVATILPAVLLALLGGVVSGRTAPPPPDRRGGTSRRGPSSGEPSGSADAPGGEREDASRAAPEEDATEGDRS